jgi:hypothetical protein
MKKLFVGITMVLALTFVANVALSDEVVPFPFWQHGWGIMAYWSVYNSSAIDTVTVTINGYNNADGLLVMSTTATVGPEVSWQPFSAEQWFIDQWTADQVVGYGNYTIEAPTGATGDVVYLWGCIYSEVMGNVPFQPGYTVILPDNPYGGLN